MILYKNKVVVVLWDSFLINFFLTQIISKSILLLNSNCTQIRLKVSPLPNPCHFLPLVLILYPSPRDNQCLVYLLSDLFSRLFKKYS